jgi:hypothetical protein
MHEAQQLHSPGGQQFVGPVLSPNSFFNQAIMRTRSAPGQGKGPLHPPPMAPSGEPFPRGHPHRRPSVWPLPPVREPEPLARRRLDPPTVPVQSTWTPHGPSEPTAPYQGPVTPLLLDTSSSIQRVVLTGESRCLRRAQGVVACGGPGSEPRETSHATVISSDFHGISKRARTAANSGGRTRGNCA